jgi:hypothetical protein
MDKIVIIIGFGFWAFDIMWESENTKTIKVD